MAAQENTPRPGEVETTMGRPPGARQSVTPRPGTNPTGSYQDVITGQIQDLMHETLLNGAPRVFYNGHQCPALGGVPLLRKLGQGGMGAVYYGMHPRLHVEVAVKVLPYTLLEKDPQLSERFFREAQISAQVRSPHLVNVMDVNEDSGVFYLVMEFVNGQSATQRLAAVVKGGAQGLSQLEALQICIASSTGLGEAHAQSIIHRDVKPENIMIPFLGRSTAELNPTHAKLMDLGLARTEGTNSSGPALTATQQALGTPGFMAPEQIMDARTATSRSDVFSMGATLYALLAGQSPFKRGTTPMHTMMATLDGIYSPLLDVRKDALPSIAKTIDKAMAKEPAARHTNAQELLVDLDACMRELASVSGSESTTFQQSGAVAGSTAPTHIGTRGQSIRPMAKPKRGLLLVSLGAGVAALGIGGFVATKYMGPGKIDPSFKARADLTLRYIAENNFPTVETTLTILDDPSLTDPRVLSFSKALHAVSDANKALNDGVKLPEASKGLAEAEAFFTQNPELISSVKDVPPAAIVDVVKKLKSKLDGQLDQARKLDDAEKMLADSTKLDEAKRALDELPPNPRVITLTSKLTPLLNARQKEINDLLGEMKAASAASDSSAADRFEGRVANVEKFYGTGAARTARNALEGLKSAQRADTLTAFVKFASAPDTKTDALDRELSTLERRYAGDAELKGWREKVNSRLRVERVTPLLKDFDRYMSGDQPDLATASATLEEARKAKATDADLGDRPKQLKAAQDKVARVQRLRDADEAITLDTDSAKTKLDALAKDYPNDTEVAALNTKLAAQLKNLGDAQEKARYEKIRKPLTELDALLDNHKTELAAIENKIADVAKLGARESEIAPYKERLKLETQRRADSAQAFSAMDKALADTTMDSAALTQRFIALRAKYPDDPRFTDIAAKIETRRKTETDVANSERQRKIKPFIDAASDLLAKAGDPQAIQKNIDDAEKAGAETAELGTLRSQLANLRKRNDNLGFLELAISGATDNFPEVEKKIGDFAKTFPNDSVVSGLREKLGQKRLERGKQLIEIAGRALQTPESDLKAAQGYVTDAEQYGAPIKDVTDLRAKLGAEKTRRERLAEVRKARNAMGDPNTFEIAGTLLANLEARYPNSPDVTELRSSYNKIRNDKNQAQLAKKQKDFDDNITAARTALKTDDLDTAAAKLAAAKTLIPDHSDVVQLAADLAAARKRNEEALARKKAESDFAANIAAARAALAKNDFAAAETKASLAAGLFPDHADLARLSADIDTAKKQAAAAAEQARIQKENAAKLDTAVAGIQAEITAKNFDRADAALKAAEALTAQPDARLAKLRTDLAAARQKAADEQAAQQAAQKQREQFDTFMAQAKSQFEQRQFDRARQSLTSAAQVAPPGDTSVAILRSQIQRATETHSVQDDPPSEVPGGRRNNPPPPPPPVNQPRRGRIGENDVD